jgi:hypothetical protein
MHGGRGWPAVLCIATNGAMQQIYARMRGSTPEPDRIGVNVMTSYLVLYMSQGARLFGLSARARLNLSPFGLLPHEIAALNAR